MAASEIALFCNALREPESPECTLVRGMAKRMEDMACVVMSAIDDDHDNVDNFYRAIGRKVPTTEEAANYD